MQRDKEFQELMQTAVEQGKVQQEMQALQKDVEKRDSDIQQLQKQLKEAEHILVTEPMHVYFSNIRLQIGMLYYFTNCHLLCNFVDISFPTIATACCEFDLRNH